MTSDALKTEGGRLAIEAVRLEKSFGPVQANAGVDIRIERGAVHAVIGENGAGKSTLMNMLYGLYRPDSGEIRVNGAPCQFASPSDAHHAGIGMVHQHFMLVENFTVLENIMLGFEGGAILARHRKEAADRLRQIERDYDLQVDIDTTISDLPVGLQQRVEILKALYRGAEILILDEPTGVLTPQEAEQLFRIIETLREQGKAVLFISHKLREVMRIADHATVMRRGRAVARRAIADTNEAELAELMVGRKVGRKTARIEVGDQPEMLRLESVSLVDEAGVERLKDISLTVRSGEIVGIAGVAGNGQLELLEVITGISAPTTGRILFDNQVIADQTRHTDGGTLRRMGLGHVAEDRLRAGAVSGMIASDNAILGYHETDRFSRRGILDPAAIKEHCESCMADYDVRPPMPDLPFGNFSGGNQQKLVIAREIAHDPTLLVIGQPTRGVDIGAVTNIHDQIISLRNQGKANLVVSADLDELLVLADRIVVMFDGRIVGEVTGGEADERTLGLMMAGQTPQEGEEREQYVG
ncbi:MAG: ABC transporter ATP-binding protein [Sphingomonadales bacterium]